MRIKHNDLVWYFIRPHDQLPASYLKSCRKFFDSLGAQAPQASSRKHRFKKTCTNPEHVLKIDLTERYNYENN
jgi:hypothetical protein